MANITFQRLNTTLRLTERDACSEKSHEHMYNNILLLTYVYPPSQAFSEVFSRTMFLKSNKAAFHQVVYYLLRILNPEKAKTKLPSWPIYEIRQENKFRNEVLAYINELGAVHPNYKVHPIMASHLICPGGAKFTKFMLQLSTLVLYEHSRKNVNFLPLLTPIQPHKNAKISQIVVDNLKAKTAMIEARTNEINNDFYGFFGNCANEAKEIDLEQIKVESEIVQHKLLYDSKQKIQEKLTQGRISAYIEETTAKLEDQVETLEALGNFAHDSVKYVNILRSGNIIVKFNKETVAFPSQLNHLVKFGPQSNKINLLQLFEGSVFLIKNMNLTLPHFVDSQKKFSLNFLYDCNAKYTVCNQMYQDNYEKMVALFRAIQVEALLSNCEMEIKSIN